MMKIKLATLFKPVLLTLAFTWLAVGLTCAQSKLQPLPIGLAKEGTAPKAQPPSRLKIMQEQLREKYKNKTGKVAVAPGEKKAFQETYYTFTGKGSWYTPANWENSLIPPPVLKGGEHIIINGKGYCLFNDKSLFVLLAGAYIEVKPGNTLYVSMGNNLVFNGGVLTNNGTVKILSGVLNTKNDKQPGDFQTTRFSKLAQQKQIVAAGLDKAPGKGIQ